jgi:heavy metal-binding protein
MPARFALLLSASLAAMPAVMPAPVATQQNARPAADIELPPISWTCPMNGVVMPDGTRHTDVYETEKGNCPICKMALVAVRLDSIWTCPVHSVIAEKHAGKCPIDRRDLVQVTVGVSWTCAGHPEIDQLAPGRCADGSAMVAKYTPRAHGNHNPQHGGQFFMAPDNWHHLEGTFPQARRVRIYLYDDYTKPLPPNQMKPVQGRIITRAGAGAREISFPLIQSRDGRYLEAKVDTRAVPASIVAKIKLKEDAPEYHFDFTFTDFSKEPVVSRPIGASAAGKKAPTPAPAPADLPRAVAAAPSDPSSSVPAATPALIQVSIPETLEEIVAQIGARNRQIGEFIELGRFAEVWFPAFEAKDLALAMTAHAAQIPADKRQLLEPAINRLLHAAWLLDAFGDVGNREQITGAYADFRSAVDGIESLVQKTR